MLTLFRLRFKKIDLTILKVVNFQHHTINQEKFLFGKKLAELRDSHSFPWIALI